jgi:SPP1 gp7 family putative phage head morphogenesis protein
MPTPELKFAIGLEPAEAIRFLESKGYAIGFKWQDVWAEAHARAFTVAGVMKVDVLQDIRGTLTEALKNGETLETFKKKLTPILQQKGWMGSGYVSDSATGEIHGKRLTPRRLDTIYQTNMQSAYMAGRFKAQLANAEAHPYWEYVAVLDNRTRPAHRALSGRIFRYDDPFWQSFYPPNGWNCRCRVRTRSGREIEQKDLDVSSSKDRMLEVEQPIGRSGETRPAPAYRDPATGKNFVADAGFGYNPGASSLKPFTPPPLEDPPRSFPHGVDLPALPKPQTVAASKLLAAELPPEQYAAAFLDEFGLTPGEARVFEDVTHAPLVISEDLFKDSAGQWKADKNKRGPFMRLIADAVRKPDEVWLRWEESRDNPGTWLLKRRYIKGWEVAGENGAHYALSVFEFGKDGWQGSTAMMANAGRGADARLRYANSQREGFLAYRRAE